MSQEDEDLAEAEHTQQIATDILDEMSNHDTRMGVNAVALALCVMVKTLQGTEEDAIAMLKYHWNLVEVDITDVPKDAGVN